MGDFAFGGIFIALAIFLFAFTTILGWSHYGGKAVEYLAGEKGETAVRVYKVIFIAMIVLGSALTSSLAWDISDTFNGFIMISNLIGVLALAPLVRRITKNYIDRRLKHREGVKPMLSHFPDIEAEHIRKIEETGEE